MSELRIAIDARLRSGMAGGVESVIMGLANGLSGLPEDAPERFVFLAYPDADDWLLPFIRGHCSIAYVPPPPTSWSGGARARLRRHAPWLRTAWRSLPTLPGIAADPIPRSDGYVERAGMHVVHFPTQGAFLTDVPSIYHPHDLQHLHLPQFFSARERARREARYRAFCRQATEVVVTSTWIRDDLIDQYKLPPEKVSIVPWAPIVTAYAEPTEDAVAGTRARLALPERFILYPAQTWPHKNHLGLLEALALLRRERGLRVPLVASGFQNAFHRDLMRRTSALGIADQVHWVGFVSPLELRALYRLATGVVVPTLFEAASGPLWEAFASGVPAACSNVTSLPEQAGGAALIFDPKDPTAIADAVARLWTDAALRVELVERGRANVGRYSWDTTARLFRAHYRRVARARLSHEGDQQDEREAEALVLHREPEGQ
ncbi:MAG: glycosyltransferase family 4 protein [Chloroflexi bacterium]|nr:glycosyltransferase family 4 protein [Chloroflexota bacterium]